MFGIEIATPHITSIDHQMVVIPHHKTSETNMNDVDNSTVIIDEMITPP